MQGSTTERNDYNYMIGKFRVLEEIEDEIKEILDKGETNDWFNFTRAYGES